MNLKRAIWISVALYVSTFILGVILTVIAQVSLASPQEIPTVYWIITIVVTVLLTSLASVWYFNKSGVSRNINEGLKLGLTFVLTGLVLDILFFIPLLFTSGTSIIVEYYSNASFYLTLLLVVASATFIGSRHQSKETKPEVKKTTKKSKN